MNQNNHLEEQVRKALENLEASYDPRSWETLEQRLDETVPNDASLIADDLIYHRLAGLHLSFQTSDWDTMERLLDSEAAAEQIEREAALDNITYEKLHRLEVPFQTSHWQLMAKRLEEEFSLRAKLYRYKVMEGTLLLLLLLALVRFLPFAGQVFQSNREGGYFRENPAAPSNSPKPSEAKSDLPAQKGEASQLPGKPIAQHSGRTKSILPMHPPHVGGTTTESDSPPPSDELPPSHLSVQSTLTQPLDNGIVPTFQSNDAPPPALAVKTAQPSPPQTEAGDGCLLATAKTPTVKPRKSSTLPLLSSQPLQKEKSLRFSIFATVDYNYVFTPADKLTILGTNVYTDSDTTAASGYGGGILVSLKRGKWEYQTGGIYSFKRYIPNTPIFLFETVKYYIEEDFNGIQLDLLQLPLNAHYHFKNQGKWRLYALAGASANFITSSVYEIKLRRVPTFAAAAAAPDPEDPKKTIRKQKDFPEGIFDGGSFDDNFYLTANLGLGIERFISPRWSLFFQPNYQHYLLSQGIGTNKDKIYTLSFYLGTKVNLK